MSKFYPQAGMSLRIIWENYQRGAAKDSDSYPLQIAPEEISVSFNDYKTADTFTADVDYRHFPFDPRTIRSMGVTIHIQDMKRLAPGDDRIELSDDNLIFNGFADVANISLDDNERKVRFTGRDFTSIFIDAQWDGSLVNLGGQTVDKVIGRVKNRLLSAVNIEIVNRTGAALPTLAGVTGVALKDKRNASNNETYWDVIQDIATRAGLIAYIEIDKLVLTRPNALYKKAEAKQFVYGRNVTSLKMERKIGRMKDVNIKLLSLSPRATPPVIEAYIPKDATASFRQRMKLPADHLRVERVKSSASKKKIAAPTEANPLLPDGTQEEREIAPFIVFRIPHAKNKAHLVAIGEEIFETMSRQQIEGSIETREMAVRDGEGLEFDVTKMRVGIPIEIRIDNDDLTGMRNVDSEQERVLFLLRRGYDISIAQALSKSISGFESPFFTKAVTFKASANSGFSMDLEFINFIELKESLLKGI